MTFSSLALFSLDISIDLGIVNVIFSGVESETLLNYLNQHKIYASVGSACTAGEMEESHVLLGIGLSKEEARGSVRFSFGRGTTKKELEIVIKVLEKVVGVLREL